MVDTQKSSSNPLPELAEQLRSAEVGAWTAMHSATGSQFTSVRYSERLAEIGAYALDRDGRFLGQLADRLARAEVAGFDETGLRVAGTLHWVHCARTDKYALITCHPKRGRKSIDDAGVLGRFRGVAVHHAWAPYDTGVDVDHQLWCAHMLRELAGVADNAPPDAPWCWADQAADALATMQQLVAEAIAANALDLDPDALREQIQLHRSAAQIGLTQTAARTDTMMRKHNALAHRLLDRQDDYLRFTHDPDFRRW